VSEFDEETEYLDAIYNVSKGSTKKNSAGPYTKTDVAAQLGAATGIGTGVSLASRGNEEVKRGNKTLKEFSNLRPETQIASSGRKSFLRANIARGSKTRAAGIGIAGLGSAGMIASDTLAYNRNRGKNMNTGVSKSAYNMLPTSFSASRRVASGVNSVKSGARRGAAYAGEKKEGYKLVGRAMRKDPKGTAAAMGESAKINVGRGVDSARRGANSVRTGINNMSTNQKIGYGAAGLTGLGIAGSAPAAYKYANKKSNKVSKSAFGVEH
jgi:hypothetical protein